MADSPGRDFFISYTGVNRPWAEWIAVQLEGAGYTTVLQAWDFRPGSDFLHQMQQATTTAGRTIAVLSPAYFGSKFGEAEWRAAFVKDPTGEDGLLVPVRVQECAPPGLLASRVYLDLVDTDEATAKRLLLAGVGKSGARPTTAPFPGGPSGTTARPRRFPGQGPAVSNLPARNRNFSGRGELLEQLYASLQAESAAAVVPTGAVHGLGGVGKTELVLEFAHRYQADYDIVWWITAEQPTTITADLAGLAEELGIERLADQAEMVRLLFRELRGRDRWLLVYDNAEQPRQLEELLPPGGGGHVLVTSRYGAWGKLGSALRLDVLARSDAVAFLTRRIGATDQAVLDALASELGDLPLALEEAAAYLEETHTDIGEYLGLVRGRSRELFGLDQPADDVQPDQRRVATIWSLSLDRVQQEAPAAGALLRLCAFLAPDDIPRELPREHAEALPAELARAVGDELAYNRLLAAVGRFSLATVTPTSLELHRLVQAVLQAQVDEFGEWAWAGAAVGLLRASFPNTSWEVATWEQCGRLLPHVLAAAGHAQRLEVAREQAGWLLYRASSYLRARGLYRRARPVAEQALVLTEAALGPQNVEVAWRRDELGRVLRDLGDLAGARVQLERALTIGEATLGPDHPAMAIWRGSLGLVLRNLGDLPGAKVQFERTLAIGEATRYPNQPEMAAGHNNLGLVLWDLRDLAAAKVQFERALVIRKAAFGPDHPTMGILRNNLGSVLWALGDLAGAKAQFERALAIGEATLGPDHPAVAIRRNNLGRVLQEPADQEGARAQVERALVIGEATLGPNHPTAAAIRGNLDSLQEEAPGEDPGRAI